MSRLGTVHHPWPGLIEAYRDRLPIGDGWTPITLREGGTPLLPAPRWMRMHALRPAGKIVDQANGCPGGVRAVRRAASVERRGGGSLPEAATSPDQRNVHQHRSTSGGTP